MDTYSCKTVWNRPNLFVSRGVMSLSSWSVELLLIYFLKCTVCAIKYAYFIVVCFVWVIISSLTHWGRDKIADISQMTVSLKFVHKGQINNIPAIVQIMAWCQPSDKPLSEPMMVSLLTHICVARPQWGKWILIMNLYSSGLLGIWLTVSVPLK